MTWRPYRDGAGIGSEGTEDGTIVRDEEHADGARITLERDGWRPFAITCGVYGWMVHTTFDSEESAALARYESMKSELVEIMDLVPMMDDPDLNEKAEIVCDRITDFVDRHL